MNKAATLLLLVIFLVDVSSAGYSTGYRGTPKPKTPETEPKPLVFPGPESHSNHRRWPENHDVSAGKDGVKVRETSSHQISGGCNVDGAKGTEEKLFGGETGVGLQTTSHHEVSQSHIVINGEEPVSHDSVPSKDANIDSPVKAEPGLTELDRSGDLDNFPDDVKEGKDGVDHDSEVDIPKDGSVDVNPQPNPAILEKDGEHGDYADIKPEPFPNVPVEVLPDGHSGGPLPQDVSTGIEAEKPYDGSEINVPDGVNTKPDSEINPDGVNPKPDSEINPDGEIAVPAPFPVAPGHDAAIVHPGVKAEILEPYPLKVNGGGENINLYELMKKLELSRFLHLVEEAELKDLLTSEGPLTIFAPSDSALNELNDDVIRELATNRELLRQFVLYHCVDIKMYGPSLEERENQAVVTRFGKNIHLNRYGEIWYINGVSITIRDQIGTNGVIHVISGSLYPLPTGDILETLEKSEYFTIFSELIRNAKLDEELQGNEIYTIFAPTDVAFSKLPPNHLEWLKWDIPTIKRMFRQLTVRGTYYINSIRRANVELQSIDGQSTLSFSGFPNSINVNGVELRDYDITANNGCIHEIDDIWFLSQLGPSGASEQKKHQAS